MRQIKAEKITKEYDESMEDCNYELLLLAVSEKRDRIIMRSRMDIENISFALFRFLVEMNDMEIVEKLATTVAAAGLKLHDDESADEEIEKMFRKLNLN